MKKLLLIFFFLTIFSFDVWAQNGDSKQSAQVEGVNFTSDGCSMFPDGNYVDCCVEHDKAYFAGGSWTARWRADRKLMKCVAAKKGWHHKPLSGAMWLGVRVGGLPFLPTSFRWGFGREKIKKARSREIIETLKLMPLSKLIKP